MIHQTTQQKVLTVGSGLGGMGLSLVNIASYAQALGLIIGCLLVTGQFIIFLVNTYDRFKKK